MKILLTLSTLCACFALFYCNSCSTGSTTSAPDYSFLNDTHLEDCNKEFDVTIDQYLASSNAKGSFPKNCYLKCVHEKMNMLQQGQYNMEEILDRLSHMPIFDNHNTELRKAVENCLVASFSTDQCDYARRLMECLFLNNHANEHTSKTQNDRKY